MDNQTTEQFMNPGLTWEQIQAELKEFYTTNSMNRASSFDKRLIEQFAFQMSNDRQILKHDAILRAYDKLLPSILSTLDHNVKMIIRKWAPFNSDHEGMGVLQEEVDELWDEVRKKEHDRNPAFIQREAYDIAAVAIRIIIENSPEFRHSV
jgi:hypothetical protein